VILHGGGDFQNWLALIMGVPFLALGIVILRNREPIARFMAETQSRLGRLGRRVARENRPWVSIMVGTVFVVMSTLLILGGLFLEFDPPGTPR
jgi:hypothetical protein